MKDNTMSDLLRSLKQGITEANLPLLLEQLTSKHEDLLKAERRFVTSSRFLLAFAKEYGVLYGLPIEEDDDGFKLYGKVVPAFQLQYVLNFAKPQATTVTPELLEAANRLILWNASAGSGREWVEASLLLLAKEACNPQLAVDRRAALVVCSAVAGLDRDGSVRECPLLTDGAVLSLL
jgi:hypothetical protein